ncbi:MAG: carbohydrate ABC transporter substrate-binding protein [Clostridiales bacterium]|nr:carbohydrate ABC transporter substrate-binding protein [Clostridiales bacterium]
MKRILAMTAAVLLCAFCLAGCSKKSGEGSDQVTLKVVTQFGGDDPASGLFIDMIKEWETQTNHKVTNDSAKADNVWKSRVIADFTTGAEPDVMFFFNGSVAQPLWDKVVDVSTIREVDPDYGKNIRESVLTVANNLNASGNPISLPVKGFAEGLFCNQTLFQEVGVDLPTDWASLMTAIEKFKAAGKIPLSVSLGGEPHYYFDHTILAVGGADAMNHNPRSVEEIPASWSKGLGLLKVLYDAGAFPADTASMSNEDSRTYFLNGSAAMYLDGSWFGVPADDTSGAAVTQKDVRVIPFPSYTESENQPGTVLSGFTSGWYITRKCWNDEKKRAAAIDFVKYQTTDEAIARYVEAGGGFAAADGAVTEESSMDSINRQFMQLLRDAPATPMTAQDNLDKAAFEIYLQNATALATGKRTPEEVLKEMAENNRA